LQVTLCDIFAPEETCCTEAKLVLGRFHMVKVLNEVLNAIGKQLRREHKDGAARKRIRCALFKRSPSGLE